MNRLSAPTFFMTALVLSLPGARDASAQIRVVNYNVAQLLGDLNDLEDVLIALHDDDKPGYAVPVSVFVFQEVTSSNIGVLSGIVVAAAPVGVTYAVGTYTNSAEDDYAGAQAMFYRSDLLTEDGAAHADIWTGAGRFADRWKLTLNDYSSPDADFFIYSMHLKAGTDPSDESQRTSGAQSVRADADSLPTGSHIIFAGDFNLDHNGEDAYWEFFDPGSAQAFDPLGTGSWSGSGGAIKHTQSPRATSSPDGLIGGGSGCLGGCFVGITRSPLRPCATFRRWSLYYATGQSTFRG